MSNSALTPAKQAFIESAISHGVLLFGEFTLKSGRKSPYFFNAGLLYTSSLLASTASAFSQALAGPGTRIPEFDILFGPAYKGISLAAIAAVQVYQDHGKEIGYGYNRKEAKDHGEGGTLVGAPIKGKIVIIDDVLTSGKAIREAIAIIKAAGPEAELVGITQLLDRQERGQQGQGSTVQEVEKEFGVPVEAILRMEDIMEYMMQKGMTEDLAKMEEYRTNYGI